MAGRRPQKVGALLKNEISLIIRQGLAGRYETMISVTDVEVAADLKSAKVFVSIYGDDQQKEKSFTRLTASKEKFRNELFKRVRLRRVPDLYFAKDNSLEEGSRISALLTKLEEERKKDERNNEGRPGD